MLNQHGLREFLLRTSNAESEMEIEEGILDGSIGPDLLRAVEDELIDDHLFRKLTQDEEKQFQDSFLSDPERRDRTEFARMLLHYASAEQGPIETTFTTTGIMVPPPRGLLLATTLVALAALILVAALMGAENWRLRSEMKMAQSSQDELKRLRAALEAEKTRQASTSTSMIAPSASKDRSGLVASGTAPEFELQPGVTRSLQREILLRVPSSAQVVWINLEFPDPLSGNVREELVARSSKDPLWLQEFTVSSVSPLIRSAIAVPTSVLSPGDYEIKVKLRGPDAIFQDVQAYSFRVSR